ncbi:hypothetical protein LY76DRAFT_217963 [Colletotrichum caudatum]|nr:hypothetical protein LY76DRAFT_217963 [Colletotrichum caudatum]
MARTRAHLIYEGTISFLLIRPTKLCGLARRWALSCRRGRRDSSPQTSLEPSTIYRPSLTCSFPLTARKQWKLAHMLPSVPCLVGAFRPNPSLKSAMDARDPESRHRSGAQREPFPTCKASPSPATSPKKKIRG